MENNENKERIKDQGRIRTKRYRSLKKLRLERDDQPIPTEENISGVMSTCDSRDLSNSSDDGREGEAGNIYFQNDIEICQDDQEQYAQDNGNIEEDDFRQYYHEMHDSSDEDFNNSSDDSDDAENNEGEPNMPQHLELPVISKLREWGTRINQSDLDDLLGILREDLLPTLPKCAKTFLKTGSANYNIIRMDDANVGSGEFVYFSIKKYLLEIVNSDLHKEKHIKLQVNADGIPLKKSSDQQFWVLSGKIHFEPDIYQVFAIAIFYGNAKPKSADAFLKEFILEVNELNEHGFNIGEQKFTFELKCFICDTPARSFLKCTLGHGGFEACERCEVVGKSVERRRVYPDTEAAERTDVSFRSQRQIRHHHGPSPLLNIIPFINLVQIFVLDFMHLCCNGIMKKLLEYWTAGHLEVRFDVNRRLELGRRMESLRSLIPIEFQRKTRTTESIAKWKATELRFFLLYCGPIILRKLMTKQLYEHFLLLHVAARILCCESLCHIYNNHAKFYLRTFFKTLGYYYGEASQILNAHHLIHVADDVISMNCNLSRITAFAFENFLGKLKRLLRTPNRQLAQVCRRLHEKQTIIAKRKVTIPPNLEILNSNGENNATKLRYKQFTLCTSSPNNMVLLNDGNIVSIQRMFKEDNIWKLECQVWKTRKPVFTYPIDSSKLNIWKLNTQPLNKIKIRPLTSIKSKLVKLELSFEEDGLKKIYVTPFLH